MVFPVKVQLRIHKMGEEERDRIESNRAEVNRMTSSRVESSPVGPQC